MRAALLQDALLPRFGGGASGGQYAYYWGPVDAALQRGFASILVRAIATSLAVIAPAMQVPQVPLSPQLSRPRDESLRLAHASFPPFCGYAIEASPEP